jgi:transcriptional regulator with XRE-family HTH domain
LPFSHLHLFGPRPREFPRGYPHEPLTLGQQICRRRLDLGLTKQTLADRVGSCPETVAAWERDESESLARRRPAIEAVLGTGLVPKRDGLPGWVRAARLRLGLTQEQLAARAGLDPRTVRNVETGRYRPCRRRTAERLWEVLGLP